MARNGRLIIGCMTGTSLDGVDAAAMEVAGRGLEARGRFLGGVSAPLGAETGVLRVLGSGGAAPAEAIAEAARGLAADHANAIRGVIEKHGKPDLIAIHGQTVYHRAGLNWQILDCWSIAKEFGAPIVFDLRGADIAHGGRGAPITPIADWMLFRDARASRCIVNLGGFCNITVLPKGGDLEKVRARDVCACNQVLDGVARAVLEAPFDEHGAAALSGKPHDEASADLERVLTTQHDEERSLGTGDEAGGWITHWAERCAPTDLAASACAAIGRVIGRAASGVDEVYLAGGGAMNPALAAGIKNAVKPARVNELEPLGVPGAYREAAAMAVLGGLCADGVPITLPAVTGVPAPAPVAGAWVFPNGPSR